MYPYRVDPTNIPAHLSNPQLEYFCLFAICVAGKSAKQTFTKVNEFLYKNLVGVDSPECEVQTPFDIIKTLVYYNELGEEIRQFKFGQYTRITEAFRQVSKLNVEDLTVEKLEAIPGIGPKTARFIMLYADPSFNGVPLDTHILKFLNAQGVTGVPHSTPPAGKTYNRLEREFFLIAQCEGKTIRQLDTEVWKRYSNS